MGLGVIADDFTGATDVGALLARSGADVRLHMGVPDQARATARESHAQIVALKCRTIAPQKAVEQVLASLSWLQDWGATHLYWKYCSTFDSMPEGNIGPVANALLDRLHGAGNGPSLHCPAFLENGRTVYKSHPFVGDQLLACHTGPS